MNQPPHQPANHAAHGESIRIPAPPEPAPRRQMLVAMQDVGYHVTEQVESPGVELDVSRPGGPPPTLTELVELGADLAERDDPLPPAIDGPATVRCRQTLGTSHGRRILVLAGLNVASGRRSR